MFTSILSHGPEVRRARRSARRSVRIMSRNIKRAAARKGIRSIPALSLRTGVPLRRTALMWLGLSFNMRELTSYMLRLDLSVSDVFAGTESNA